MREPARRRQNLPAPTSTTPDTMKNSQRSRRSEPSLSEISESEPRFQAALDYLRSFSDYEELIQKTPARRSFDLGRLHRLLAELGHPENHAPKLHVTGTKGKSSVVFMADAILRAHGLRSFRFLSPHLESVRERLAIDGHSISPEGFADAVDRLRPLVESRRDRPEEIPSFFESMTVMGFLIARERDVDASVIEVGLGGRLDATNVIDPVASLITPIGLDHTRVLGPDRISIAGEKAGIIKDRRPVVSTIPPSDETHEVLAAMAREKGAPFFYPGEGLELDHCQSSRHRDGGPSLHFRGRVLGKDSGAMVLRCGARHQAWNALLALCGSAILLEQRGQELDWDAAGAALEDLRIPGRAEWFPGAPPILLDGAHTLESCRDLASVVDLIAGTRPVTLLCGMTRDRDPCRILQPLIERCHAVITTAIPSPRSFDPKDLAHLLQNLGAPSQWSTQADAALELARRTAGAEGLVCVAGSLYLAGSLRGDLRRGSPLGPRANIST